MESSLIVLNYVLYALHVLVCIVMILAILLQAGKSAGIGAGLGGGSSQTLFGASGGQGFLAKFTTAAAIVFMLTSIGLAKLSTPSESRFEAKVKAQQEKLQKDKGEEVDLEELGVSMMPEEGEEDRPAEEEALDEAIEEAVEEEVAEEGEAAEQPAPEEPAPEEPAPEPAKKPAEAPPAE